MYKDIRPNIMSITEDAGVHFSKKKIHSDDPFAENVFPPQSVLVTLYIMVLGKDENWHA